MSELRLWCSPATRDRIPPVEHPRDLRSLQVVHLQGEDAITLFRPGTIIKVPIHGPAVDGFEALIALVLTKCVVGSLPFDLVEPDVFAGRLVQVLPGWDLIGPETDLQVPDSLRLRPLAISGL